MKSAYIKEHFYFRSDYMDWYDKKEYPGMGDFAQYYDKFMYELVRYQKDGKYKCDDGCT